MDNCFQVRRLALFSACASPESDGRTRLEPVLSENSLRPMADAISATNRRIIQCCLSPNTTICVTRRERVERVSLSPDNSAYRQSWYRAAAKATNLVPCSTAARYLTAKSFSNNSSDSLAPSSDKHTDLAFLPDRKCSPCRGVDPSRSREVLSRPVFLTSAQTCSSAVAREPLAATFPRQPPCGTSAFA